MHCISAMHVASSFPSSAFLWDTKLWLISLSVSMSAAYQAPSSAVFCDAKRWPMCDSPTQVSSLLSVCDVKEEVSLVSASDSVIVLLVSAYVNFMSKFHTCRCRWWMKESMFKTLHTPTRYRRKTIFIHFCMALRKITALKWWYRTIKIALSCCCAASVITTFNSLKNGWASRNISIATCFPTIVSFTSHRHEGQRI